MARKWNLKSRIIASTRKIFYYSPLRREAIKRSKEGKYYRCFTCKRLVDKVQIDHVEPVIDIEKGWEGYDVFVARLFCDSSNLSGICVRCHERKTKKEQVRRRKAKAAISGKNKR